MKLSAYGPILFFLAGEVLVTSAWANGTRLPSQDGAAVARGYAVVASSESGSSVYYNPAGLAFIARPEIQSGVYILKPDIEFTSKATGNTVKEQSNTFYSPHFFATTPLADWITVGVGMYSPFGESTDWPVNSGFAGKATFNEIRYLTGALAAAFRLSDRFSVGFAIQYSRTRVNLNSLAALSASTVGPYAFKGADNAVSGSIGVQWRPTARQHFGLQYQRQTNFQFDGTASLAGILAERGRLPWVFPDNLAVGWAITLAPDWDVEFSYDRTFWNRLNQLSLAAGPLSTALQLDWQDSAYYGIGTTHRLNGGWSYSAGYNYSENSVPNKTFSPSLPDVSRHLLAGGIFFTTGAWRLQWVIQRGFESTRTVNGPAPDGVGGSFAGEFHSSLWASNIGASVSF